MTTPTNDRLHEPAEMPPKPDRAGRSSILDRAVTLLELVVLNADGIGVREAARQASVDRSAVSRILAHLEQLGWVQQVEARRGAYTAGPELFSIAAVLRTQDSLWRAAEPILAELVDQFEESCYLAVRQHNRLIFRDRIECTNPIRYVLDLGKPFRLTTGAAGTAILSGMPDDEVDAVLAEGLERYTSTSITDPAAYRATLVRDRQVGYSLSRGRWVRNGAGIAAPFFNANGNCVGALTRSCPADRLDNFPVEEVGAAILAASRRLSRRLGYVGTWGP